MNSIKIMIILLCSWQMYVNGLSATDELTSCYFNKEVIELNSTKMLAPRQDCIDAVHAAPMYFPCPAVPKTWASIYINGTFCNYINNCSTIAYKNVEVLVSPLGYIGSIGEELSLKDIPESTKVKELFATVNVCKETSSFQIKDSMVIAPNTNRVDICCFAYCSTYSDGEFLKSLHKYCHHLNVKIWPKDGKSLIRVSYHNSEPETCSDINCFFCLDSVIRLQCDETFAFLFWSIVGVCFTCILSMSTYYKIKIIKFVYLKIAKLIKREPLTESDIEEAQELVAMTSSQEPSIPITAKVQNMVENASVDSRLLARRNLRQPGLISNAIIVAMLIAAVSACTLVPAGFVTRLENGKIGASFEVDLYEGAKYCLSGQTRDSKQSLIMSVESLVFKPEYEDLYKTCLNEWTFSEWADPKKEEFCPGFWLNIKEDSESWLDVACSRKEIFTSVTRSARCKPAIRLSRVISLTPEVAISLELENGNSRKHDHYVGELTLQSKQIGFEQVAMNLFEAVKPMEVCEIAVAFALPEGTPLGIIEKNSYNNLGVFVKDLAGSVQCLQGSDCALSMEMLPSLDPNVCNSHFGPLKECTSHSNHGKLLKLLPVNHHHYTVQKMSKAISISADSSVSVKVRLDLEFPAVSEFTHEPDCNVLSIVKSGQMNKPSGINLRVTVTAIDAFLTIKIDESILHCRAYESVCNFRVTKDTDFDNIEWECGKIKNKIQVEGTLEKTFRISEVADIFHRASRGNLFDLPSILLPSFLASLLENIKPFLMSGAMILCLIVVGPFLFSSVLPLLLRCFV